jgi:predicted AAA+ superfamily ATPase
MRHVPRKLAPEIVRAARSFPAVVLTGPRRAGKTTLLESLVPDASYVLLEDPDVLARVRADPRTFLAGMTTPAVLDEIQNAPELFSYVRALIDAAPSKKGRWYLTGSQEAPLMREATESLAGRAALFQLLPLSVEETPKTSLLRGCFPEPVLRPSVAGTWFRSYVQTYLERDVRAVTGVRDLAAFRRFLALVASRVGQVLNKTDLAAPLGVSVPTIGQWLSVLEVTGQILLVAPYFESFGKRIVKSPKLYFVDSGLACHLLGIDTAKELDRSPFLGPLYEGRVASEIVKRRVNAGRRPEIYWFRDHQGLEVDFLVPKDASRLVLIEAKATRTPLPRDAASMDRLAKAVTDREIERVVVHRGGPTPAGHAISPGTRALTVPELIASL